MTTLDEVLSGVSRLSLDTAVFIYFTERNPRYVDLVREVFRRIDAGLIAGRSSVVTLTEVLTHPKRMNNPTLERRYRRMLLDSRNFRLLTVTRTIAASAADLRARYNLRTPDAIQLATAIEGQCQAFLTNDLDLRRVADLPILVLDELTL